MNLPNFLIIGATKAGTTALHQYLRQHPQVFLSHIKEPHYFSFKDEFVHFCGPGDKEKLNRTAITNFLEYGALFDGVTTETAIGEASPLYLYYAAAPQEIYRTLPAVKLIAILRNPVDRAYSSYLHLMRDGREPCTDFDQALTAEPMRIAHHWAPIWYYKQLGFYYEQLQRYYLLFSPKQIRVYLYEDFVQSNLAVIRDICSFLGIDTAFEPDVAIRPNVSGIPRSKVLHKFLTHSNVIKEAATALLPPQLLSRGRRLLSKARTGNLQKPPLSSAVREELVRIYRNDIVQTQLLIGRDLSQWLKI